jgi:hypothetical protein
MKSWKFRKKPKKQQNLVKAGWLLKTKYVSVPKLIKKLDIIFSKYKRLSNMNKGGYVRCFTCGAFLTFRMADCGHYVGRECMATRYEEKNTEPQCHSCNRFAEGKKDIFAINLQKKYGVDILVWLNNKKNEIKQWTAPELEALIKKYQTLLQELSNER